MDSSKRSIVRNVKVDQLASCLRLGTCARGWYSDSSGMGAWGSSSPINRVCWCESWNLFEKPHFCLVFKRNVSNKAKTHGFTANFDFIICSFFPCHTSLSIFSAAWNPSSPSNWSRPVPFPTRVILSRMILEAMTFPHYCISPLPLFLPSKRTR